jgi:hypothetical protein
MAEFEKDIFGKADALLRRHSIAPPADGSETGGVPMLTAWWKHRTGILRPRRQWLRPRCHRQTSRSRSSTG